VIILGALDTEPVELRIEAAHTLEDADVARCAKGLADELGFHNRNLLHRYDHVKRNFCRLLALLVWCANFLKNGGIAVFSGKVARGLLIGEYARYFAWIKGDRRRHHAP
jgi:hypothetical protein